MHSRRPIASHVAVVHSEIGRRPVRVARARLGQPQGRGLPVEAQRCLFRRERVGHDACGCPAPRTRCYATAAARAHELDANRAGVCDMGVQARGLLPAAAGRWNRREGSVVRKEGLAGRQTRAAVSGKQRPVDIYAPRRPKQAAPRRERRSHVHSQHQVSLKRAHADAAAQPYPIHKRGSPAH